MMTAIERRANTETILKQLNIPLGSELQLTPEESDTTIRSASDIAKRVLILTYLNIVAQVESFRAQVVASLKNKGLWDDVSGNEKLLLLKKELSDQDKAYISWQSEAAWMLLWSINKVEIAILPTEECDVNEILKLLPSFEESIDPFVNSATTRPATEILNMLDMVYTLHWAVSDAEENENPIPAGLSPGVVHERHYALNWVTNIIGKWDEEAA